MPLGSQKCIGPRAEQVIITCVACIPPILFGLLAHGFSRRVDSSGMAHRAYARKLVISCRSRSATPHSIGLPLAPAAARAVMQTWEHSRLLFERQARTTERAIDLISGFTCEDRCRKPWPPVRCCHNGSSTRNSAGRAAVLSILDRYQRIAPFYDLLDLPFEHGRYRRLRPMLFAGMSGRILDAGIGTGRTKYSRTSPAP